MAFYLLWNCGCPCPGLERKVNCQVCRTAKWLPETLGRFCTWRTSRAVQAGQQNRKPFHLKANTPGETCGDSPLQQVLTGGNFKMFTEELLADFFFFPVVNVSRSSWALKTTIIFTFNFSHLLQIRAYFSLPCNTLTSFTFGANLHFLFFMMSLNYLLKYDIILLTFHG